MATFGGSGRGAVIHIGGLGVTQAGRSGVSGSLRSSTLTPPSQGVRSGICGNKESGPFTLGVKTGACGGAQTLIRRGSKTSDRLRLLRGLKLVKPIGSSSDRDAASCRFMVTFLVESTCSVVDFLGPLVADWQTFPSGLKSSLSVWLLTVAC